MVMIEKYSNFLRGRVIVSSKEKSDKEKKKMKKLTRKLYHSSINLLNKIYFRWKSSLVIIMNRKYLEYSNWTMQSTVTLHLNQKLKKSLEKRKRDNDEKKEAKANKRSKRSDIKETPPIILGEYVFVLWSNQWCEQFMCWWNTTCNIKKDNEKNRAFSDNIWRQASKLQDSCVLSFLSLGLTGDQEMNYRRLTEFHNRALVTAEACLIHTKQNSIFAR